VNEVATTLEQDSATATKSWDRVGLAVIGIVIAWNMWQLRATANAVAYLNDSAMHEQMVRFATQALQNFHLPMTQWYPYLNLGSPQFLHYQGLAATLAGGLGLLFSPNGVFRWSLYLLLVLWPIAIYFSAKIMRLSRGARLAATLLSPFLISAPLVGYEQKAYIWVGFGLWAQLCASWALPFAWAFTWRALDDRRHAFKAVFFIALAAGLHFETGYMAFGALVILPFVIPKQLRTRLKNAVVVFVGAVLCTAWLSVPLLLNRQWAAINTAIAPTGLVRGYGARQDLAWLFTGRLFDAGRLPIITICVALGFLAAIVKWKHDPLGRALVLLFSVFFLISWGPTTWGPLIDIVPGHADIYFRRFEMSVSLSGILLSGYGVAWLGALVRQVLQRDPVESEQRSRGVVRVLLSQSALALSILAVALVIPSLHTIDAFNSSDIGTQRHYQAVLDPAIQPLIKYVKEANNGRVYAGMPGNWGASFTVGYVPVFEYLANQDVDEVGFTLRTASLMEQAEPFFDQSNPADYPLFGVRYLLLPPKMAPPVPARFLMGSAAYRLYEVANSGYFSVITVTGSLDENKGTVAAQSPLVLSTDLFATHRDYAVHWNKADRDVSAPQPTTSTAPGVVVSSHASLVQGTATVTVAMARPGSLMLSASYDPGWQVTVDGKPVATQMVAPALVAAAVPAGVHTVTFTYQGFQWYLELGLLALFGFWWTWRRSRKARTPN